MKLLQTFQTEYQVKPLSMLRVRDVIQIRTAEWGVVCLKPLRNSEEAEFITAVLTHLRQNGFHRVPKVFLTRAHSGYCTLGKQTYMVTNWFNGVNPNFEKFSLVRDAAATLAEFHRYSHSLPATLIPERKWKVDELASKVSMVRRRIEGTQDDTLKPLLSFCQDAFDSLKTNSLVTAAIRGERNKRAFIHGDYNFPNLIRVNGCMYIIDFDNTSAHVRVRDLTHLIQRNCLYKTQQTQQLIDTYNSVRSLSIEELALLKTLLKVPFTVARSMTSKGRVRKSVLLQIPSERQIEQYHRAIDLL